MTLYAQTCPSLTNGVEYETNITFFKYKITHQEGKPNTDYRKSNNILKKSHSYWVGARWSVLSEKPNADYKVTISTTRNIVKYIPPYRENTDKN